MKIKFPSKFYSKVIFPEKLQKKLNLLSNNRHLFEEIYPKTFNQTNISISNYINKDNITKDLSLSDKSISDSVENGIFKPGWDLIDRGGKMWRPLYGLLIGNMFDDKYYISNENVLKLLFLVEVLHNASLIIDDIEDKSEMRRNKPCVHLIYGEDISINCGVSMIIIPFYNILNTIQRDKGSSNELVNKIVMSYFQEVSILHIGQNLDIEMKYSRVPNEETYYDVVLGKTGSMLRLAIKFILSTIDKDSSKIKQSQIEYNNKTIDLNDYLISMSNKFAIAFQIKDDILNIKPSKVSEDKGFIGEDIFEGKQSLMVLNCLNNKDVEEIKKKRLMEILYKKTKEKELIKEAIDIINSSGALFYSETKMKSLLDEGLLMCRNLNKIGVEKEVIDEVEYLVRYLIDRI